MFVRLVLAFSLLMQGCATVQYREPKVVHADDGAVVLRVLPNMLSASQYFKNWQDITVERLSATPGETGPRYAVRPTMEGTSRSAIYAGALPPGEYRIVQFSAQSCGMMCVTSSVELGSDFSIFEIRSRTLTDLGVIVQTSSPSSDRRVLMAHDSVQDPLQTREIVETYLPDLKSMLAAPPLSWKAESVIKRMPAMFNYGKQVSFGFASPQETGNGSFIYGSANGMLYDWTPGRRAAGHDVGLRSSIEATLVASNGDWIAGGELSLLQQSSDRGQSWHSIRGNLPLGVVVSVKQWKNMILATVLRGNKIDVHRAELGSTQWQAVASYQMDVSRFWDVQGVRPQSYLIDDTLITTVPGRKVAVLDLARGTSQLNALPGGIQMFSVSGDRVLRCRCIAGIAVNSYESGDMGKTWRPSASSRFMMMPAFRDTKHGVAFKGAFTGSGKMAYTEDGGATWIESVDAPDSFGDLFYSKDGKAAYGASAYGAFWMSEDDGRTWRALRK